MNVHTDEPSINLNVHSLDHFPGRVRLHHRRVTFPPLAARSSPFAGSPVQFAVAWAHQWTDYIVRQLVAHSGMCDDVRFCYALIWHEDSVWRSWDGQRVFRTVIAWWAINCFAQIWFPMTGEADVVITCACVIALLTPRFWKTRAPGFVKYILGMHQTCLFLSASFSVWMIGTFISKT